MIILMLRTVLDEANTEYFNAGLNSKVLEGAQLSGGSRSIELRINYLGRNKVISKKYANWSFLNSFCAYVCKLFNYRFFI